MTWLGFDSGLNRQVAILIKRFGEAKERLLLT